jgi:hypothetical protein
MNDQKLYDQAPNNEIGVEKRRRFIKGMGLAGPVVLSLVNRSAFGGEVGCLSQQLSGNMSQVGAGSCVSGFSPNTFLQPVNSNITPLLSSGVPTNSNLSATVTISGDDHHTYTLATTLSTIVKTYNWSGTPYMYGKLTTQQSVSTLTKNNNGNGGETGDSPSGSFILASIINGSTNIVVGQLFTVGTISQYVASTGGAVIRTMTTPLLPSDFNGGTVFSNAFGYTAHNSTLSNKPMREILLAASGSLDAYCVTALLNAAHTPASNPPYVLTVQQVKGLCAPSPSEELPSHITLSDFLASTWLNQH